MGFKNTGMTNAISAQRLTDKHQSQTSSCHRQTICLSQVVMKHQQKLQSARRTGKTESDKNELHMSTERVRACLLYRYYYVNGQLPIVNSLKVLKNLKMTQ
jgi:hypothetical protein